MEVDAPVPSSTIKATTQVPLKEAGERQSLRNANDVLTQEGSFHSAKEEQTAKITMPTQDAEELVDEVMQDAAAETIGQDQATEEQHVDEHELDTINTPSDASTPDRPVLR
jgi:hypothetical protein